MRLRRLPFFAGARPAPPPGEPVAGALLAEAAAGDAPPPPLTPAAASRERRALAGRRELELRDVGGLAVEMVRRDRFKADLLISRCNDVLALEQRIWDLDSYLAAAAASPPALREATLCRCGAPLVPGAHFCSHCGRPAADTPPVVACTHCGNPLPAGANFCSFCGNSAVAEHEEPAAVDDTLVQRCSEDGA
jgi:hypothetical protein